MHIQYKKKSAIYLFLLPIFTVQAQHYQVNNGTVSFTVSCQENGVVKANLVDTKTPRLLMITSLTYSPKVAGGIYLNRDVRNKGYTPFDEILNSKSFEYIDAGYGEKNGRIEIDSIKLKEYLASCEN
jgi:hypothetical protein